MRRIENLLSRLEGVKKSGKGWIAKCPAHADSSPSLTLSETPDERILMHCFAGCPTASVLDAISMKFEDLYPEKLSDYLPSIVRKSSKGLEYERQYFMECQHRLKTGIRLTDDQIARMKLAAKRLKDAA